MTLDDMITTLTEIKAQNGDDGTPKVLVTCPIADTYCWTHSANVRLETPDGVTIVALHGGIGA